MPEPIEPQPNKREIPNKNLYREKPDNTIHVPNPDRTIHVPNPDPLLPPRRPSE